MKRNGFTGIGGSGGFVQKQSIGLRVVVEDLRISSPIQNGVDLVSNLFLGEMLIQNVPEELQRYCPVRFPLKSIPNLLNQCDMRKEGFAKKLLSCRDVGFCELLSSGSNPHISLL